MTKNCGPLNILDIFSTASLSLVIVEKKTVCARNGFLFTEVFFGTKNKILRSASRALENMSTLKSAYLGVDKPTFERGGGGSVISEIFCRLIPRRKKLLQGK